MQLLKQWIWKHTRSSRLGRRLFLIILLFSSLLVLLSTAFQSYVDYRKDLASIRLQMDQIGTSHIGGIVASLWEFRPNQVRTQLEGIYQLPHIAYLEIVTTTGEHYEVGSREKAHKSMSRDFPLRHGEDLLGTLKVVATLDEIIRQQGSRALVNLAAQFTMIFFVAIFLMLLFSNLVTRHLSTMADYALRLNLNNLDEHLELERSGLHGSGEDELDQVVNAFNKMRLSLLVGLQARMKAEGEVRTLNAMLEKRVEERTLQLAQANQELQEATEAAQRASQAKSIFLSNMSHELRTPLNAILGFARLMRRGTGLRSQDREHLDRIHRAGEHLLGLINDVLSISKIEAGKLELNPVGFALRPFAQGLEDMMQVRAQEKKLSLEMELDPLLPEACQGDEGKLRQVLINLLGNAVKFTAQGSVGLRILTRDGRIYFEVWDTGAGIAPHELEQLFKEFTQTETGRQSKEGTGLGLHISHAMVKLMGGELEVRSQVGHGTTFFFALNLEAAREPIQETIKTGQILGLAKGERPRRILVVDDQPDNRDLARELLEAWGLQVQVADNGLSALEVWEKWQPEAIFMDLRMPVMGGEEAVLKLREKEGTQRRTPVFALSASVLGINREQLLTIGFDAFLQKPFQEYLLAEALERSLGIQFTKGDPKEISTTDPLAIPWQDWPEDWRQKFKEALLLGDLDEAFLCLEQLGEHPAREYLESQIKGFHFEVILEQMDG